MRQAYDVEQVRAAEASLMARLPRGALMQRAAAGLAASAAAMLGRVYGARVVLLVGSGDNGGDALWAGARLAARGARVDAVLVGSRTHAEGLAAFRRAGGREHRGEGSSAPAVLSEADLVLDGILGIGGRGGLRGPAAALAGHLERCRARVVAVDVPSGVDAATGVVDGVAVRADATVTFGAWKPGLLVDPGAAYAGAVTLVDIGLDDLPPVGRLEALQAADVAALLPRPGRETDKYRRGAVGVVAGSETYPGAAVLAAGGALHGPSGFVRFVSVARAVDAVRHHWPETVATAVEPGDARGVLAAGKVQAWAVGPGMGTDAGARGVLEALLGTDLPVVVDADGLTMLAHDRRALLGRAAPTLLTPHAGELARMLGSDRSAVEARRLGHVRRAAAEYGATVLLKGSTTVVADPTGVVRVNPTGTPWLGTAGTGDVLTGLGGALLAAGLAPVDAGSAAAYLHGLAGRTASTGDVPCTAQEVLAALPAAWRIVRKVTSAGRERLGLGD